MNVTQPFRLLDLPKELRLLVYEWVPRRSNHHRIRATNKSRRPNEGTVAEQEEVCLILITKSVETAILATCKTVNEEANEIVRAVGKIAVFESTPKFLYAVRSPIQIYQAFLVEIMSLFIEYTDGEQSMMVPQHIEDERESFKTSKDALKIKTFTELAARELQRQAENGIPLNIHLFLNTMFSAPNPPGPDSSHRMQAERLRASTAMARVPNDLRVVIDGFVYRESWEKINSGPIPGHYDSTDELGCLVCGALLDEPISFGGSTRISWD